MSWILAIDQGTTSTRALVFDEGGAPRGEAQLELTQHFPQPGWVEHEPEEIWSATVETCRVALRNAGVGAKELAAIGITNQRETTILWERATGRPIARAIVWQDRRTASECAGLASAAAMVQAKTGLIIDPYFSATKIAWLLDNVAGARAAAERGELAFGTVDTFLLWRLTGGRVHATDATNAARTMLFDIVRQEWDDELLTLFRVPRPLLPEVRDCVARFGETERALLGASVPVLGIAGDQQAATVGQACFAPGMVKSTYGTGCFAVMNTGDRLVTSKNRLLATVAYRLDGRTTYAVEGSIFIAGAAVQWLRDGLGLIRNYAEVEALAAKADRRQRIYLVPAFTGLGAPYWDASARGALFGLTRETGAAEIVQATLEAVCYQTRDLVEAMVADGAARPASLRVDGGMTKNAGAMQLLADIVGVPVERPVFTETTVAGAAALAALGAGLHPSTDAFAKTWRRDRLFEPRMGGGERDERYAGWRDAVRRTLTA